MLERISTKFVEDSMGVHSKNDSSVPCEFKKFQLR